MKFHRLLNVVLIVFPNRECFEDTSIKATHLHKPPSPHRSPIFRKGVALERTMGPLHTKPETVCFRRPGPCLGFFSHPEKHAEPRVDMSLIRSGPPLFFPLRETCRASRVESVRHVPHSKWYFIVLHTLHWSSFAGLPLTQSN